jgi:hypothetical protein
MADTGSPVAIPFPLSTFPGANPQESGGRLINCYAEPLGEASRKTGPAEQVWRRSPGLSLFGVTSEAAGSYRGGLLVNNLTFEVWANVYTASSAGVMTSLGPMAGTQHVSIAHNQKPSPDVVAVDIDNGAFLLTTAGVPSAPASYNGGGNLSQPNSVCFQDGYFFYTIGDGRCFASPLNSVGTINTQTFITAQSKSDVTLLRGIAYSGLLWLFTTGGCEIWQDAANVAPAFPYSRLLVLEYGLVQPNAIAGWETGFSMLMWAAQDFGVYLAAPGSFQPQKVSPPDLEKLIEIEVRAGHILEASCYAFAGNKFWVLASPLWTWEFNLTTQKWNERWSLIAATGNFGRWRCDGGHPAFGKWLMGSNQSGDLLWLDRTNYTENGNVQLVRIESGAVTAFPNQLRIARADFLFDTGVGQAVANIQTSVMGAAAGPGGVVRLTVFNTQQMSTNDTVNVSGVGGTTEANGTHLITVIDASHIDLQGTLFVHAWTSGGTVVDVTAPPNIINPVVAVSLSKDGGVRWGNPLIRQLGQQAKTQRMRVAVKSMGLAGPAGCRWRLDVSDPVYTAFLKGTMAADSRDVGI